MSRATRDYVGDDGTTYGPRSIVHRLHYAFASEDEDLAYSLSQHAADWIEALVVAINRGDPTSLASAVAAVRTRSVLEEDWPGDRDFIEGIAGEDG
jgi:hypothetical protein